MVLDGNRNVLYSQRFHRIVYSSIFKNQRLFARFLTIVNAPFRSIRRSLTGKPLFTESVEEVRSNLMICATKWPRNH